MFLSAPRKNMLETKVIDTGPHIPHSPQYYFFFAQTIFEAFYTKSHVNEF